MIDQAVNVGYAGSPVYDPVSCEVIGMFCVNFEEKFAMCVKASYIGDALAENFILKLKRKSS